MCVQAWGKEGLGGEQGAPEAGEGGAARVESFLPGGRAELWVTMETVSPSNLAGVDQSRGRDGRGKPPAVAGAGVRQRAGAQPRP